MIGPVQLTRDTGPELFEAIPGAKSHARPDGGSDGLTVPHIAFDHERGRGLIRWGDYVTVHDDGRVHVVTGPICQVARHGLELLTCPAHDDHGYRCERLDEHGDDEHAIGEHTKDHDRIGNGYACDLATPMIFGSDPADGPCL